MQLCSPLVLLLPFAFVKVNVQLQVLAPGAGIAEVARNRVCDPLSWRSSGGALPGIEPTLSDCSGCKVRGLHHCATTP